MLFNFQPPFFTDFIILIMVFRLTCTLGILVYHGRIE